MHRRFHADTDQGGIMNKRWLQLAMLTLAWVAWLDVSQVHAQGALCTAQINSDAPLGNLPQPIACIRDGKVLASAVNRSDATGYDTQTFANIQSECFAAFDDPTTGRCRVNVGFVVPMFGISGTTWVDFGDPLEHGEGPVVFSDGTSGTIDGVLVVVQEVACFCDPPPRPPF
jgi:hypothetical protein